MPWVLFCQERSAVTFLNPLRESRRAASAAQSVENKQVLAVLTVLQCARRKVLVVYFSGSKKPAA